MSETEKDLFIGKGSLLGRGVYANRDFKIGEVVIQYSLKPLSLEEYELLSTEEKMFTHSHWDQIYLYGEPGRYVNHSDDPNTFQDLINKRDIAARDIKRGEMITCNSEKDDVGDS